MPDQDFRIYGRIPYSNVFVHGGPGAVGEMAEVARNMASVSGVIETLHRARTVEGQIRELNQVLNNIATNPVCLVGFSWGAWLSILYCARYQDQIKKLILIGCGPLDAKYAQDIYTTRLNRLNVQDRNTFKTILNSLSEQSVSDRTSLFNELSCMIRNTDSYAIPDNYEEHIEILPDVFISVWKEAELLRKDGSLLNALKRIEIPIQVIHGDYDPHPAAGIIKPLHQYNNLFNYEILKQCGHKPWIEKHACARFYDLLIESISDR